MPLTLTRPIAALRPGILTIKEAWEHRTGQTVGYSSSTFLEALFPGADEEVSRVVYGGILCTKTAADQVLGLNPGQLLTYNGMAVACAGTALQGNELNAPDLEKWDVVECQGDVVCVERPWHLFQYCGQAIETDIELLRSSLNPNSVSGTNTVIGDPDLVFMDDGASVEACTLNTQNGPIYLGKDSVIMEGCHIRGPFALGEKSQVKMGAKIYGPSAFVPECRAGGEISNSVMLGYSNKGHDGFLGNSVLGEWCNLGADTNNSNLKNNYGEVRVYSYEQQDMLDTGLQFCGLIMGDHSKAGINTMFNTGTVVGVCANIFGEGFPPKHIPSFSWGGTSGFESYNMEKAIETAINVMKRRGVVLRDEHRALFQHVKDKYGYDRE